jgi:hypothetical protein
MPTARAASLLMLFLNLSMTKVHFSSAGPCLDLPLLLPQTKIFSRNELGGKARQPLAIIKSFNPTIEGLMKVEQIRIEAGAIEQPEENATVYNQKQSKSCGRSISPS